MAIYLLTQQRPDDQPSAQMRGKEQQFKPHLHWQSFLHQTQAVVWRFLESFLTGSTNILHDFHWRKTLPQHSPKYNLSKRWNFALF